MDKIDFFDFFRSEDRLCSFIYEIIKRLLLEWLRWRNSYFSRIPFYFFWKRLVWNVWTSFRADSPALFLFLENFPHRLFHESQEVVYSFVEFPSDKHNEFFPKDDHVHLWNSMQCSIRDEAVYQNVFHAFHTLRNTKSIQFFLFFRCHVFF